MNADINLLRRATPGVNAANIAEFESYFLGALSMTEDVGRGESLNTAGIVEPQESTCKAGH